VTKSKPLTDALVAALVA